VTGEALHTAADDLTARLTGLGPDARTRPGPRWCFPPCTSPWPAVSCSCTWPGRTRSGRTWRQLPRYGWP
jgi:hypothetical protein